MPVVSVNMSSSSSMKTQKGCSEQSIEGLKVYLTAAVRLFMSFRKQLTITHLMSTN